MNQVAHTLKSGRYVLNDTLFVRLESFRGELSIKISESYSTKILSAVEQERGWKITYMFLKNMREAMLTKAPA